MTPQTLKQLAEALGRAFPDLKAPNRLTLLGEGFRSIVVQTDGGIVFRIGKSAAALDGYRVESRILPVLQGRLPVAVPDPRWLSPATDAFPFGVVGYRKIPGVPVQAGPLSSAQEARIAADLAAFLVALHRFPAEQVMSAGIPSAPSPDGASEVVRTEVLPVLRACLTSAEYQTICRWWDACLADPRMHRFTPTLRHGDLWYEHLLLDEEAGRITGIVDFEEAALGDVARDFSTQLHLGSRFLDRVLIEYGAAGGHVDDDLVYRIWRLWEAREFDGVAFAARSADHAELQDALRKLRAGPILSPPRRTP